MNTRVPQLSEHDIFEILDANGVDMSKPCVLAVRGYYLDSMGKRGTNDRRVYDDAMFIVQPGSVSRFQANTDPNGYRVGRGTGQSKGMAMLKKGVHIFGEGPHKGYPAFRQCEKFTVIRDGKPDYEDKGFHAINLHSGGYSSTSSLGCQTIPKQNWKRFKSVLSDALIKHKALKAKNDWGMLGLSFPYVLVEETDLRKNKFKVSDRFLKAGKGKENV